MDSTNLDADDVALSTLKKAVIIHSHFLSGDMSAHTAEAQR
jgi:hypothetical protein